MIEDLKTKRMIEFGNYMMEIVSKCSRHLKNAGNNFNA